MKYIALLRGVMPTGKNKVMMADLNEVVSKAGYDNVTTYIQSGNIIFDSDKSEEEISSDIHETIKNDLGPELPVIVKTVDQLQMIADHNPYKEEKYRNSVFYIATSMSQIDTEKQGEIQALSKEGEYITFTEEAIYYYLSNGMHNAKINNNFLEKKLGITLTTRNQNTIEKIIGRVKTN